MPRPSRLKLPPLPVQHRESFGQRLARRRKERGFTQVELAQRVGLIQTLVSDYERDKLRPHADVIVRFALALEVTADELLGLDAPKKKQATGNRRFLRRLLLSSALDDGVVEVFGPAV